MTGFVRAVAVEEKSLLGRRPVPGDVGMTVIDEARRSGMRVILMSGRTLEELGRGGGGLLSHFDGVVAKSGAVLRVGLGPTQWVPTPSRRAALLEVLHQLDVDPHDALGVSGAADSDLAEALEVWVVVAGGGGDFRLADAGPGALERVLDRVQEGWPEVSPERHDIRLERGGRCAPTPDIVVPGGHANLLVCAASDPARDVPLQLAGRWSTAGYQTLVLDLGGWSSRRSTGWGAEGLDAGAGLGHDGLRVDARSASWSQELAAALNAHRGLTVLALAQLEGRARSVALGAALSNARTRRSRTGRPHWLVIDPVEEALSDPDLPPHALDLNERGHCLVLRRHAAVPSWLVAAVDVFQPCSPDCAASPWRTRSAL
jgi:hypothetical protein